MVKRIHVEGRTPEGDAASAGSVNDEKRQAELLAKKAAEDRQTRIAEAAESFNKYHKLYSQDHHLSPDETAAALFLENLNFREFWPESLGGIEEYDRITREVYDWFEANKHK